MNPNPQSRYVVVSAAALFVVSAAFALLAPVPARAQTPDTPKTHTLFMGADISVGPGKELYSVKDVVGFSWVVDANGKQTVISANKGPLNIKVTPSLKLTEVSATVADMKSERGYTFDNDPLTKQTRALSSAASLNAGYQAANNQAQAAVAHAEAMQTAVNATSQLGGQATIKAGGIAAGVAIPADVATYQSVSLNLAVSSQAAAGPGRDLEVGAGGQSSGYDAMNVSFIVSSERPLSNPYIVTVTKFHPLGGSQGVVQNLVYARSLDPIDSRPVAIHLLEGGFPAGFEVIDFQLHLYNRGDEVATSVSSKRVPLSRDEAFEYVKMEYVGAHKGDTLEASPAMGRLPPDLPARLAEGKYRDTLYVKVSKDGVPTEIYQDASCSRKVDDLYLQSLVNGIRFKPALKKGRPVESVAPLNVAQLKTS